MGYKRDHWQVLGFIGFLWDDSGIYWDFNGFNGNSIGIIVGLEWDLLEFRALLVFIHWVFYEIVAGSQWDLTGKKGKKSWGPQMIAKLV